MTSGFDPIEDRCVLCHMKRTEKGHDPCIADLPGVLYACCGHGFESGYMKFEDGRSIIFETQVVNLTKPTWETSDGLVPVYGPDDYEISLCVNAGAKGFGQEDFMLPGEVSVEKPEGMKWYHLPDQIQKREET